MTTPINERIREKSDDAVGRYSSKKAEVSKIGRERSKTDACLKSYGTVLKLTKVSENGRYFPKTESSFQSQTLPYENTRVQNQAGPSDDR